MGIDTNIGKVLGIGDQTGEAFWMTYNFVSEVLRMKCFLGEALRIGCIFSRSGEAVSKGYKITFLQENFNMKDVTVPLLGEVFWIKSFVARHWERVKVYIKAFSSFSLI